MSRAAINTHKVFLEDGTTSSGGRDGAETFMTLTSLVFVAGTLLKEVFALCKTSVEVAIGGDHCAYLAYILQDFSELIIPSASLAENATATLPSILPYEARRLCYKFRRTSAGTITAAAATSSLAPPPPPPPVPTREHFNASSRAESLNLYNKCKF